MSASLTGCAADALAEGQAITATTQAFGQDQPLIIVKWQGTIRAFRNWCPHMGTPLDWEPGKVWNYDHTQLMCATHGAMFEPDTGLCTRGPCRGQRLHGWQLDIVDGMIVVAAG